MAATGGSRSRRRGGGASEAARAGVEHLDLEFDPGSAHDTSFRRADLVFRDVQHGDLSYEVRVFLNNREADATTARSPETGYAGRFVVFGHGGCYGEAGHCDPPAASAVPSAAALGRRTHPMQPQTRIVTVTEQLRRILETPGRRLESVSLVPVSKGPERAKRGPTASLFRYGGVALQTYR